MSTITSLNATDNGSTSRGVINTNFTNLNTDKAEISGQVFTGAISATNLSGTNTGDQTISDVTISITDVTTNNVTSTKHGFAPKSPADATKFLNGDTTPAFAQVKDSDLAFTDVTTNNVSATAHGFAPKFPNNTTTFLRGDGTYAVPATFTFKSGVATRTGDAASGSQTIAHGLGKTPSYTRIVATKAFGSATNGQKADSWGSYNGTTTACVYSVVSAASASTSNTDTTNVINIQDSGGTQVATISVDSTNITLTWTKTSTPNSTVIDILWEVIG